MARPSTADFLRRLKKVVAGKSRALIVVQNNPDPDAIASAVALKTLLKELVDCDSVIAYGGMIGRAENRSMLKHLGTTMREISEVQRDKFDLVAMVDTQPGFGNNPVDDSSEVDVVIDHHEPAKPLRDIPFADVRPDYGSSSTMLSEYLRAAGITPTPPLATALVYGIQSDTQDFGRETSDADIENYTHLYPLANKRHLSRIENEQEPREYFTVVSRALREARTYENFSLCWLGRTLNPDMTGEIADFLVRCDEIDWALCQGLHKGTLYISLRSDFRDADADGVMREIISGLGNGGGHEMIAGGQIDIERDSSKAADEVRREIERRFLEHFKLDPKIRRLLVSRAGERKKKLEQEGQSIL